MSRPQKDIDNHKRLSLLSPPFHPLRPLTAPNIILIKPAFPLTNINILYMTEYVQEMTIGQGVERNGATRSPSRAFIFGKVSMITLFSPRSARSVAESEDIIFTNRIIALISSSCQAAWAEEFVEFTVYLLESSMTAACSRTLPLLMILLGFRGA